MKKRHIALLFASVVLLFVVCFAVANPAAGDFEELLGTWFCQEYDGLYYEYESITWEPDGTTVCYSTCDDSYTQNGPFTVVEKWSVEDGSVFAKLACTSGDKPCFMLLLINPDRKYYEGAQVSSLSELPSEIRPGFHGYRFYYR